MINKGEKNFISAVVYVHDNAEDIGSFLARLRSVLTDNFTQYEIICVDDSSSDGTQGAIKDYCSGSGMPDSALTLITLSYHQGLEIAMNAGVDLSIGDFVYEFDTVDIDYDFSIVMSLYRRCMEGFDIVSAAPDKNRLLSSTVFYSIYNIATAGRYKLQTETLRILSRRSINRVHSMLKTIPYRKAVYASCGLSMDKVKYKSVVGGARKSLDRSYRSDTAISSLILFTDTITHISLFLCVCFLAFAFGIGLYAVIVYLMPSKPVQGWAPLMGVLSVSFSGVFLLMSLIIKYLSIVLKIVWVKQSYIVKSIEKVNVQGVLKDSQK